MQVGSKSKRVVAHDTNDQQQSTSRPAFEVGSYVMARWKNNYEYLAEVLAFRQRSRDHPEYRIRFSWDGIVEWTPATSIRLAEQNEINYVLRFIRQHKQSDLMKREPTDEHEKKAVSETSDEVADTSVAKGDMLYDRSIAQFHEACRKRRELKKRATTGEVEGIKPEKPLKLGYSSFPTPPTLGVIKTEPSISTRRPNLTARKTPFRATVADAVVPSEKVAPITFQCPHCPRKLRRQSLLTAHLQNYHSAKSVALQSTIESSPPPKKKKIELEAESQPPSTIVQPEHYVFCPICKFSGSSAEPSQNLIRCIVCRVWSHRKCTLQSSAKTWTCTSCQRTPSKSGLTDWPSGGRATESREFILSGPDDNCGTAQLMQETSSLINWLRHLNKLIVTGRHALCRIRGLSGGGGGDGGGDGGGKSQSLAATSNAIKESSGDTTATDLAMDFPFITAPHVVAGEEHFNALESTDITRILANLANSSPEELPDLMTAIPEDLLNVPTATQQSQPPAQVQSVSPGCIAPPPLSSTTLDTPTKSLLASLEQVLYQGGSNNKSLPPPTAITIEADLQRPLPVDTASPFFTTPVKNPRSTSTSVSDIEAAASLIGFAESSGRAEFGLSTASATSSHDEAKSQNVSSDLEYVQSEILTPLEEMIGLIESRLDVIESQVAKAQGNLATPLSNTKVRKRDGENPDGGSVSALSRTPVSSHSSLSSSSSSSPSPTPPHDGGDTQSTAVIYPQPKSAPKRRTNQRPFC